MAAVRRCHGEAGETLIEAVVALAIFGIAFLVIVGGIFSAVAVSDRHRRSAIAETVLRHVAEDQENAGYVDCAVAPTTTTVVDSYVVHVDAVAYWNGSAFVSACATPDEGLQLVTVRVDDPEGRASETVDVVRRSAAP